MTTRDMTRKKQRSRDLIESSSSEEMVPSKPPKDVLGLGRHLVRELGLEVGVDTLGRWMAHHLAELIDKAENSPTEAERLRAKEDATETVLKIWEHRISLPGKAYPLTSYENILLVLDKFRPNNNDPYWYFGHHSGSKKDQLAVDLFDNLSRLIIALLLMNIPSSERTLEVDHAATDALSEAEQYIFITLQQWGALFKPTPESLRRTQKSDREESGTEDDLPEVSLQLIDRIITTLVELKNVIEEPANSI